MLSKYFHSGKAGAAKQGKLSPPVRVGELSLQLLVGLQPQEKEQEEQLHHHQLPTPATTLPSSPPRAERGRPTCTWRTKWSPAQVNTLAGCQTRPDPRDRISEPGSWRAQGPRPAASPAHLHPPAPPAGHWFSFLLPPSLLQQLSPFSEPLEAATHHITSLPPSLHFL